MAAQRTPYQESDVFGGTAEERSEAISTYLGGAGRFEVLTDEDTVVHHVEVCSYPNWIGDPQKRFAKLEGDLLTLSTNSMTLQGVERTAELVWQRVGRG
jgi:lipocalin-like protein